MEQNAGSGRFVTYFICTMTIRVTRQGQTLAVAGAGRGKDIRNPPLHKHTLFRFLCPATHTSPQLQLALEGWRKVGGVNRSSGAQSSKISAKDNAN